MRVRTGRGTARSRLSSARNSEPQFISELNDADAMLLNAVSTLAYAVQSMGICKLT